MPVLTLAPNLKLPPDAVTQTLGFFGRKGSGKTYAAGKLVETFLDAQAQCVILDPVGNWYGLRLDKSGKRPSRFSLPILGGENGDVPLQSKAGAVVADFIVSTGSSAVIDVSRFRKGDRKEFVTDFAEELFHKKKISRSPMHLVIEEAQVFAPQKTFKGEERMLGALEDIVRLGRNYGIGASMISQRPQSVNTELRNQCEPLVVFQLVAKHERDAIGDWMEHMGVDSELEALSTLQEGECFFWSPAWLKKFVKSKFEPKETFDASATPRLGAKTFSPQKLAPVDLDALQTTMKATIEQAKADDPKELRRQISELKRQIGSKQPIAADHAAIERAVSSAVAQREREWQAAVRDRERVIGEFKGRLGKIESLAHVNGEAVPKVETPTKVLTHQVKESPPAAAKAVYQPRKDIPERRRFHSGSESGDVRLGKAERAVLQAIYWMRDDKGIDESKIAFYSGYTPSASTVGVALSKCRKAGLIEHFTLTDAGIAAVPNIDDPKPTGERLREWLRPKLGLAENKVLDVLIANPGQRFSEEELADQTGYSPEASTIGVALSKLKKVEAAEGGRRDGGTRASDVFYEVG